MKTQTSPLLPTDSPDGEEHGPLILRIGQRHRRKMAEEAQTVEVAPVAKPAKKPAKARKARKRKAAIIETTPTLIPPADPQAD